MQVISRKAAKAAGLTHYFTGKPCKRGNHIDRRYVASFCCVTCAREKERDSYRLEAGCSPRKLGQDPEYQKKYYAARKERRKAESREWYRRNAETALTKQKAYVVKRYRENPEAIRLIGRRSAAKRREVIAEVFVEVVDPRVVFERDSGTCGICGRPVDPSEKWEVDHIVPISRGGHHAYDNVQLAHLACNRSKSNKMPESPL